MSEPEKPLGIEDVKEWWQSAIVDIAPGSIRFRGYDVQDLIGHVSFPAMIWLMLRGELPSPAQADLFGALLVSAVDHGPQAPSIAVARMTASCGVGINNAIASGVNALGDVHGGAGQQCMHLFADIERNWADGASLEEAVKDELENWRREHGKFIPGFGHRFHRVDPRVTRLSELLDAAVKDKMIEGRFLAIGRETGKQLGKTAPIGMNVDGITAVLLLELGFPAELGRGVFVLSRSVGICAHALEQMQQGHRIKGPTPPEIGFQYTGPAPRRVPPEAQSSKNGKKSG
jgi:citrate synthase